MAASHTYAAIARVRQRGFANCRVRLESIICSKPSADPAAACCCCERRIFRASHRHVRHIACARRRRLFAVEPFADATRAVRWRLMSRQALHSTRQRRNRQRRKSRFRGGFALRHALFQLVSACGFVACQPYKLDVSKHAPGGFVRSARNDVSTKQIRMPNHFGDAVSLRENRIARMPHEPCDTRAQPPTTSRWFRARCPSCAAP